MNRARWAGRAGCTSLLPGAALALGLAGALALGLLPGHAEGAGKGRGAVKPHKRVAILAPEHTGQSRAVANALLKAAEGELAKGGFEVLSQAKVAAEYRKRFQAVPYCSDAVPCLSRAGATLGVGFVLAVVAAPGREGVDAALTIVDADRASLVARIEVPGVASAEALPEVPSPSSAIYRHLGEQESHGGPSAEPAPAAPAPEPKQADEGDEKQPAKAEEPTPEPEKKASGEDEKNRKWAEEW